MLEPRPHLPYCQWYTPIFVKELSIAFLIASVQGTFPPETAPKSAILNVLSLITGRSTSKALYVTCAFVFYLKVIFFKIAIAAFNYFGQSYSIHTKALIHFIMRAFVLNINIFWWHLFAKKYDDLCKIHVSLRWLQLL